MNCTILKNIESEVENNDTFENANLIYPNVEYKVSVGDKYDSYKPVKVKPTDDITWTRLLKGQEQLLFTQLTAKSLKGLP